MGTIAALQMSRDFKLTGKCRAQQGAAVSHGDSGNNSKTTNQNTVDNVRWEKQVSAGVGSRQLSTITYGVEIRAWDNSIDLCLPPQSIDWDGLIEVFIAMHVHMA